MILLIKRTDRRVDVFAKVTGQAQYTNDMKIENLTYGKVIHCPYPHAKIIKIDVGEAEAYPGGIKVITAKDVPGILHQHKQKPMLVKELP